ncbi:MAG TPA: response regulator [Candidatus Binatia bacterium]|nr:response regulator [Candidatus Binatia bacterium]
MAIPILVVDDEPNFLALMESALGKRGFDVNTASNRPEALKLLEREMFDFALIDLKLGPTDGIQLLSEIKRRQPRVRAIMVTGYPTEESRDEARQTGASAYLSKPVELHELFQTFQEVLTNR